LYFNKDTGGSSSKLLLRVYSATAHHKGPPPTGDGEFASEREALKIRNEQVTADEFLDR
jgi:hypothetical protein